MTITPDPLLAAEAPLSEGETLLATFHADPAAYWRNTLILAVVGGFVAGAVLVVIGNPSPWVGPVAALAAIAARAAYLRSEAMADRWRLTDRRLLGPRGRIVRLAEIKSARPFLGDVQIITLAGDKHLMKFTADAQAVIAAIEAATHRVRR